MTHGYGALRIRDFNGWTMDYAHRISWQIHRSLIPEGLFVLHHCGTTSKGLIVRHLYKSVDHPTYNGRTPIPGEKGWNVTIPISEEDQLELELGQKTRNAIVEVLNCFNNILPNDQKALMLLEMLIVMIATKLNLSPEDQKQRAVRIIERASWIDDLEEGFCLANIFTGIEQLQDEIRS